MRLLKKLGGVDLYKRVEKAPDAITLIQAGKKTPFIHFRRTNINDTLWIKTPSGNDYEAC
jgi:hypothetical protein